MKNKTFYLNIDMDVKKGDNVFMGNLSNHVRIITPAGLNWYRCIFKVLSLGLYKIPTSHKVKIIDVEEENKNRYVNEAVRSSRNIFILSIINFLFWLSCLIYSIINCIK